MLRAAGKHQGQAERDPHRRVRGNPGSQAQTQTERVFSAAAGAGRQREKNNAIDGERTCLQMTALFTFKKRNKRFKENSPNILQYQ